MHTREQLLIRTLYVQINASFAAKWEHILVDKRAEPQTTDPNDVSCFGLLGPRQCGVLS